MPLERHPHQKKQKKKMIADASGTPPAPKKQKKKMIAVGIAPADASEAGAFRLEAKFWGLVRKTLPQFLWPQNITKADALSYTLRSSCGAALCIRTSKTGSSFSSVIERTCSAKGSKSIRKSTAFRPGQIFEEWWHAIRAMACECDETVAWKTHNAD